MVQVLLNFPQRKDQKPLFLLPHPLHRPPNRRRPLLHIIINHQIIVPPIKPLETIPRLLNCKPRRPVIEHTSFESSPSLNKANAMVFYLILVAPNRH